MVAIIRSIWDLGGFLPDWCDPGHRWLWGALGGETDLDLGGFLIWSDFLFDSELLVPESESVDPFFFLRSETLRGGILSLDKLDISTTSKNNGK